MLVGHVLERLKKTPMSEVSHKSPVLGVRRGHFEAMLRDRDKQNVFLTDFEIEKRAKLVFYFEIIV